jgi:hypothetical protein
MSSRHEAEEASRRRRVLRGISSTDVVSPSRVFKRPLPVSAEPALAALRFNETGSSNGNRVGFWFYLAGHLLATLTFRLLCATNKRVHSFAYSKSLRNVNDIVFVGHGCLHGKMGLRLYVDRRRHCCSIPVLRTDYAPRGFLTSRVPDHEGTSSTRVNMHAGTGDSTDPVHRAGTFAVVRILSPHIHPSRPLTGRTAQVSLRQSQSLKYIVRTLNASARSRIQSLSPCSKLANA